MRWLAYALLPAMGALLLFLSPLWPASTIEVPHVIVPAARIVELEPPTEVRWRDRIVYRYIGPRQVLEAPGGGAADVAAFCRPTVLSLVDTVEAAPPDPVLLLRGLTHHPGWLWQRDQVVATGPTSTGDLFAFGYDVRPGFSVRASGDSLLVRYPRTGFLRELLEVAVLVGTGWGAAKVF